MSKSRWVIISGLLLGYIFVQDWRWGLAAVAVIVVMSSVPDRQVEGYGYFLADDARRLVRVGFSRVPPDQILAKLQEGSDYPLRLLDFYAVPNMAQEEFVIKEKLRDCHYQDDFYHIDCVQSKVFDEGKAKWD